MKSLDKNKVRVGVLSALSCEILFGLSYLFTKSAGSQASALALLGWRFLVAFIFMLILLALKVIKVNFRHKDMKHLLFVGLFSPVLYFIGETFGINWTTASETGAFLASIPIATLVAANLILQHVPTKNQVIGISTTVIGVLVSVFAVGFTASFSFAGYLMLFLAVISYALYAVYVEKAGHFSGTEITFFMIATGFTVFGLLAVSEAMMHQQVPELLVLPFKNMTFGTAILYQGIGCSVLAFFLSNKAIETIGVNETASFIGVSTAVSIISGILFLGESFSFVQFLGVALIMIGVYISNRG